MNLMSKFDGTGRTPRRSQLESLLWMQDNYYKFKVLASNEPVGSGKSFIAKSIQNATGGIIVTPSNILIEQYTSLYKSTNFLKGKVHYACKSGLTCEDWTNGLEQTACEDCPYLTCTTLAKAGAPTIYNPMSLYFSNIRQQQTFSSIVIDEAHQLPSMLLMLCQKQLRWSVYKWLDTCVSEVHLIPWLRTTIDRLQRLSAAYKKANDLDKAVETHDESESLKIIHNSMASESNNFALWISDGFHHGKPERYLNIRAIRPPRYLTQGLLKTERLVLMSGTLFDHDIQDLVGTTPYAHRDAPSPIPKERRPVLYKPAKFKMNYQTDPKDIAGWINEQLTTHPNLNTMVHVTYSLSRKLEPFFPNAIFNTPQNKEQMVERFKVEGGLFIAAGCAEGLDLKGDWCRLNLIPKLNFPDRSDEGLKKRVALEGGEEWYDLETLKVLIQQIGRSTRGETDWSISVIGDPNFSRLFNKRKSKLPEYFREALDWTGGAGRTFTAETFG